MLTTAVIGAAGYVGGELLRLLLGHPRVEVAFAGSTRFAGRPVSSVHPHLRELSDLMFHHPDEITECEVVFLAVDAATAMALVPRWRERADCLVDLSPGFRLRRPEEFAATYGQPHRAPHLLESAVCGWPEANRARLRGANLISVPGCMASAAILGLWPLVVGDPAGDPADGAADGGDGLVDGEVVVDGRIGSSGSGASADQLNLHAERSGAMRVFAPHSHRHGIEVAQATGLSTRMSATGVEAVRGAQVLCHVPLRRPVREVEIRRRYRAHYAEEPFVRVVAQRRGRYRLPEPKILSGSNFCDVGFSVRPDGRAVTVVAALDNLGKGGAGNAVQCLNVRMGWSERLALEFPGLHPI